MKRLLLLSISLLYCSALLAIEWHNPQECTPNPVQGNTSLRFRTSSPNITIRSKHNEMVELYGTDNNGGVMHFNGESQGKGEKKYTIDLNRGGVHKSRGYEYQLWFSTSAKELEVGVDDGAFFNFKECRQELPIVIYSTDTKVSPVWQSELSRAMDRPIVDMGVSKKFSTETIGLMAQTQAKAFIIDSKLPSAEQSILALRKTNPETPILVSDAEVLTQLTKSGSRNVWFVENKNYESKLREVLNSPMGNISTTIPVVQSRAGSIEWHDQCGYILKELRAGGVKSAVIGNSIVQNWCSDTPYEARLGGGKVGRYGLESWRKYMDGYVNMGIGSDRVENLLWRVYNDQFEIVQFERIIIMVGTNNIKLRNTYDEIALGIDNLIAQIQIRQPQAQIIVVGVLPRKDMSWEEVQSLNAKVEPYAIKRGVKYVDVGQVFLDENNTPRPEFYGDGVHLSSQGYMVYNEALMNAIK